MPLYAILIHDHTHHRLSLQSSVFCKPELTITCIKKLRSEKWHQHIHFDESKILPPIIWFNREISFSHHLVFVEANVIRNGYDLGYLVFLSYKPSTISCFFEAPQYDSIRFCVSAYRDLSKFWSYLNSPRSSSSYSTLFGTIPSFQLILSLELHISEAGLNILQQIP